MTNDCYRLYFRTLMVGVVKSGDRDFSNLWGNISYNPAILELGSEETLRFIKFVELSWEEARLVELEHEQDVSEEQKIINARMNAHYMDYIESEDWYLLDGSNCKLPILCPVLYKDSGIVWRWNPGNHT